MRVGIYVRVSTQRQAQADGIAQQLERLGALARQEGWTVGEDDLFRDDGFSGASLKRPGLERLRDRAAAHALDAVLVTAPDRLARNYVHQVLLLEELAAAGCRVEFLDRPMGQDPHDQLLLQIRGAVAEYERSLIAERMRQAAGGEVLAAVAVVRLAVVGEELVEGHAGGRRARQRRRVGEVAARPRPDPLRRQDLRREPHGEGPLQPAALAPAPPRAPLEVAGGMGQEEAGGIEGDLGRAPDFPSGAADGLAQGRVQRAGTEVAPGEPPKGGVVRDHAKAEHAAELAGQAQEVFQAPVGQAQPLAQQQRGEQGGGGVDRGGEAARRGRHAARHRRREASGTKQLIVHDPPQMGTGSSRRRIGSRQSKVRFPPQAVRASGAISSRRWGSAPGPGRGALPLCTPHQRPKGLWKPFVFRWARLPRRARRRLQGRPDAGAGRPRRHRGEETPPCPST
jgi:predicted site-specific integrase-resolvase